VKWVSQLRVKLGYLLRVFLAMLRKSLAGLVVRGRGREPAHALNAQCSPFVSGQKTKDGNFPLLPSYAEGTPKRDSRRRMEGEGMKGRYRGKKRWEKGFSSISSWFHC